MSVNEDNIETLVGSANIAVSSTNIIKTDKKGEDDNANTKVEFKGGDQDTAAAKNLGIS